MRERRFWTGDLGLYADTLRHVVIHCSEIDRIAKRETARKAMRLEGAEGNDDNFGIFRCEAQRRGDPTSGTITKFPNVVFGIIDSAGIWIRLSV